MRTSMICFFLLAVISLGAAEVSLIENAGFESWAPVPANTPKNAVFENNQAPTQWKFAIPEQAKVEFSAVRTGAKSGDCALRINKIDVESAIELQYYMLALEPQKTYRFTIWVKNESFRTQSRRPWAAFLAGTEKGFWNDKKGVSQNISFESAEWTEFSGEYTTTADQKAGMLRLHIPAGTSGAFLVDDFNVMEKVK